MFWKGRRVDSRCRGVRSSGTKGMRALHVNYLKPKLTVKTVCLWPGKLECVAIAKNKSLVERVLTLQETMRN